MRKGVAFFFPLPFLWSMPVRDAAACLPAALPLVSIGVCPPRAGSWE